MVLREEPGLVRDFAERLRAKLAMARSAAVVSDSEWEWYICCRWETRQRSCGARKYEHMLIFLFDIYEILLILLQFATHMEGSVATMESTAAGFDNRMI